MRRACIHSETVSALILGLAMLSSPASAQESSGEGQADSVNESADDAIVVTARRREEKLADVPAAITAFGAEALQDRGLRSEADLQSAVPGLVVREALTSNQINFSIRGQTVDAYTSSQPGVLPYVNEVQISGNSSSSFYDLDGIQVLKGPQGTLFGRNTTGGAVLFATAKPTDELEFAATARLGSYDRREVEAMVNLPVTEGVSLRLAGTVIRRDGYVQNLTRNEDLGRQKVDSGRISLLIEPASGIKNTTVFQYTQTGGTNLGGRVFSLPSCASGGAAACAYNPANPAFAQYAAANGSLSSLEDWFAAQKELGFYTAQFNSPNYFSGKGVWVTNTTEISIGSDMTLKNIVGYNNNRANYSTDVDGSPYNIFNYGPFYDPANPQATIDDLTVGQLFKTKQLSNELQLQGSALDGALDFIVGGFYSYQSATQTYPQFFFDFSPGFAGSGLNVNNLAVNRSYALFGQGTIDLSTIGLEGLSATGGIRNTWETASSEHLPGSTYALTSQKLKAKVNRPSWQIGLDYKLSQDVLIYALHRGSFRSGGFNAANSGQPGTASVGGAMFLPEKASDVELGAKFAGSLGSARASLNLAAYRQVVTNVQRATYLPGAIATTINVPKAVVQGVEVDGQIRLANLLTIGGSLSYIDAKFTRNDVVINSVTYGFGPYPDTPEWSGSVFAQIEVELPETIGVLKMRGDYYRQSPFFFSSTEDTLTPGTKLPGYDRANFRIAVEDIGGTRMSAALFVNNAFGSKYYTGGLSLSNVLGVNTAIQGAPRMWGVELGFKL